MLGVGSAQSSGAEDAKRVNTHAENRAASRVTRSEKRILAAKTSFKTASKIQKTPPNRRLFHDGCLLDNIDASG